jgi:hypothetical protein
MGFLLILQGLEGEQGVQGLPGDRGLPGFKGHKVMNYKMINTFTYA